MRNSKRAFAAFKAVGVISAVMVVAGGVTFAALQSQNVILAGNRITSATANLLVGNGDGQFVASAPGFSFDNVEPGGEAKPTDGNLMYLRNSGTSDLTVRLAINGNTLHNQNNINLNKVFLVITPVGGGDAKELSIASLTSAYALGNPIPLNMVAPAGQDTQFLLRVKMAGDAVTSTLDSVTIYGVDIVFSGATGGV